MPPSSVLVEIKIEVEEKLFIQAGLILLQMIEMGELRLKIPELKKSKELQRFILESLSAKSKLTLEDAMELGNKVKEGMLEELKERGVV